MSAWRLALGLAVIMGASVLAVQPPAKHQTAVIDIWMEGKTAFGVFVPNESPPPPRPPGETGAKPPTPKPVYTRAGGERLAANPLYDFVFLNLEGSYDPAAVKAIADGLRTNTAGPRKALLVRIPTIERDGLEAARTRIKEAFDSGADGVTVPHVRSAEEAKQVLSFFQDAKVDIWSPQNPKGEKLAMLMIEDPGALAEARTIADLKGYSILACGIGSLTQAFGGNRERAEAGNQQILAETERVGLVNMLTASPQDVEQRVKEGFLALLGQGPSADEMIKRGRAAAGRQ